jgi:hypothetical protein
MTDAIRIDPRDATTEIDDPTYRVEFGERAGQAVDTWRLTGGPDVEAVLRWAREQASGRSVTAYVEYATGDEVLLLRLLGRPSAAAPSGQAAFGEGPVQ